MYKKNCNIQVMNKYITHRMWRSSFGGLTSEAESCGQTVVNLLYMQVKSSVKLPACFLSFALQVCEELPQSNTRGHI